MTATLSFGYDTERPYGPWGRGARGVRLRAEQLQTVRSINQCLDELEVPRTFFILGDYLEQCVAALSIDELRSVFDRHNPWLDLQQHSYSHPSVRPIPGRPDDPVVSPQAFGADLERANRAIEKWLGIRPSGLRIPRGYAEDLHSLGEVAAAIADAELDFVSSDLRSPAARPDGDDENFEGRLTPERQPHSYQALSLPGLIEIPSHGYQDVVFTSAIAPRIFGSARVEETKIADHYGSLMTAARELATVERPAHVALCLHPFAVAEYDPDLRVLRAIVAEARRLDVEIVHYRELADRIMQSGGRSRPATPSASKATRN